MQVLRTAPKELVLTLEHLSTEAFIDVAFLVLAPEQLRGRTFRLKITPEYAGKLFEVREFRLRLAVNLVFGKNRERKNADGTTTVWSDTDGQWNFEGMMLEAIKETNPSADSRTSSGPNSSRQ